MLPTRKVLHKSINTATVLDFRFVVPLPILFDQGPDPYFTPARGIKWPAKVAQQNFAACMSSKRVLWRIVSRTERSARALLSCGACERYSNAYCSGLTSDNYSTSVEEIVILGLLHAAVSDAQGMHGK